MENCIRTSPMTSFNLTFPWFFMFSTRSLATHVRRLSTLVCKHSFTSMLWTETLHPKCGCPHNSAHLNFVATSLVKFTYHSTPTESFFLNFTSLPFKILCYETTFLNCFSNNIELIEMGILCIDSVITEMRMLGINSIVLKNVVIRL